MANPEVDQRSARRRERDEQIAAEPKLPPPQVPAGAVAGPVEEHLRQVRKRPFAVEGVVENGLVRPVDSGVRLAEGARVIIVGAERE